MATDNDLLVELLDSMKKGDHERERKFFELLLSSELLLPVIGCDGEDMQLMVIPGTDKKGAVPVFTHREDGINWFEKSFKPDPGIRKGFSWKRSKEIFDMIIQREIGEMILNFGDPHGGMWFSHPMVLSLSKGVIPPKPLIYHRDGVGTSPKKRSWVKRIVSLFSTKS